VPATPPERRSEMRETVAPSVRAAEPDYAPPVERTRDVQQFESVKEHIDHRIPEPAVSERNGEHEFESDHPLNRNFGDLKPDAGTTTDYKDTLALQTVRTHSWLHN